MLRFPRNKISGTRVAQIKESEVTIAQGRINGGMNTTIDTADIEDTQLFEAKNATVRYDHVSRRFGTTSYVPASPNTVKVMLIRVWERFSGINQTVRFTPTTVHLGSTTAWSAVAGVLVGGVNDRFNIAITNDRLFFANNGIDYIQEINAAALTFARAGNAPKYKYLTSFNNRLIGANLGDVAPNRIQVGWSGDLAFTEWDPAVNISAGNVILTDGQADYADIIQGIFGFTDIALLLRTHSLWSIVKQPVATSPFLFNIIAPGIGCDCPNSAVSIRSGICWLDKRTRSVYVYKVGMTQPESIAGPIEKTIIAQIDDVNTIFGSYNSIEDEYTLAIPRNDTTVVKMYTYNFRTKAWSYDEQVNISSLVAADYLPLSVVIDDLVGVIDNLSGTIDNLGSTSPFTSRIYGKTDGAMTVDNKTVDTDVGVTYTSTFTSKIFWIPRHNGYVTNLRIEYLPLLPGTFSVYWSRDGGMTWNLYKSVTWTNSDINFRKLANFRKHLKCSQYQWKLEATSGAFDLIEYEVHSFASQADTRTR